VDRVGEFAGGLEALVGVEGEGAEHEGVDGGGQARELARAAGARGGERLVVLLEHELAVLLALVGRDAGQQDVEGRAEGVDVGAHVGRGAEGQHLGGEVGGGAEDDALAGLLGAGVQVLGDAEVDELDDWAGAIVRAGRDDLGEEAVRGLDVAVDQRGGVDGGQGVAQLQGERGEARPVERTGGADDLREVLAAQVLHDKVGLAARGLAVVEGADDVAVALRDLAHGPGLAQEPAADLGVGAVAGV
jgi:hypothetical protein